jgi:hypothetical protein
VLWSRFRSGEGPVCFVSETVVKPNGGTGIPHHIPCCRPENPAASVDVVEDTQGISALSGTKPSTWYLVTALRGSHGETVGVFKLDGEWKWSFAGSPSPSILLRATLTMKHGPPLILSALARRDV